MDKYTFHEQVVNLKKFIEDTKMASPERKLIIGGMVSSLEVRYELDMSEWRDEINDMISRKAAITAIQKAYADTEGGADRCAVWKNVGLTNALHIMQDLPSAQPEIIRCKDCKYWGKRGLCEKWDHYISNEDFYCGCAERRTDE